jgi:hypothetical protein
VTPIKKLIQLVDTRAYSKLEDPTADSFRGKNPFVDEKYMEMVERTLDEAFNSAGRMGDDNVMAKNIKDYYNSEKFDLNTYNQFITESWEPEGSIDELKKWGALGREQQMGLGIWCLKLNLIRIG